MVEAANPSPLQSVVLGQGWEAFEDSFPWKPGEHHVEWDGRDANYNNYASCHTCGATFSTLAGGMWEPYQVRDGLWRNDAHCPNCECSVCALNPHNYEDETDASLQEPPRRGGWLMTCLRVRRAQRESS